MNKTLVILILAVIVLSWNFIFSSEKKIDLTDQAKVLQGLSLAVKYKAAVIKYWRENQALPDKEVWNKLNTGEVDISRSLVKTIDVSIDGPGVITVYFMNKDSIKVEKEIDDKKIMLEPVVLDKKLDWRCFGNLPQDLLPKRCQFATLK